MSLPDVTRADILKIMDAKTRDMAIVVFDLGLWNTVRNFAGTNFMFDAPESIYEVDKHPLVAKYGHSGASFGLYMRQVQSFARKRNGIAAPQPLEVNSKPVALH